MYSPLDYGTACTYPLELAGASIRESSAPLSRRAPHPNQLDRRDPINFCRLLQKMLLSDQPLLHPLIPHTFRLGLVCGSLGKIGFDECVGISRGIKFETRRSGCRSRFVPARAVPTQNSPSSSALPFRFTDSRKDARHGQTDPPFTWQAGNRPGFGVGFEWWLPHSRTSIRLYCGFLMNRSQRLPTFSCSEQTGSTWA